MKNVESEALLAFDAEADLGMVLPAAPCTAEESGLSPETLLDLVRKILHSAIDLSGVELARRMGVPFTVIESALEHLKSQRQIEVVGGSVFGAGSYRFRLTEAGRMRAQASLDRNHYSGVAPVPLEHYRAYMDRFIKNVEDGVTPHDLRRALDDLVLSDQVLDELGPALGARQSILIYGPPGNGKTHIARSIRHLLKGSIAIPHALEFHGNIIRFFDPSIHKVVENAAGDNTFDQRWVLCERPMVMAGGELTLESLMLEFEPRSGFYRAPIQTLANGGVLVIDDFGRQQCAPSDLLNWWTLPLESRVEYMTLPSGQKIEMPFQALVVFSTNLQPSDLVDEAFLRRIPYKIYAESPSRESYIQIFARVCADRQIDFNLDLVEQLLSGFYQSRNVPLRACHPRDLINQALALASYRGQARQLTGELLEAACASYFILEDREVHRESA